MTCASGTTQTLTICPSAFIAAYGTTYNYQVIEDAVEGGFSADTDCIWVFGTEVGYESYTLEFAFTYLSTEDDDGVGRDSVVPLDWYCGQDHDG